MGAGVGCLGIIFFAVLLLVVAINGDELGGGLIWFCIIGAFVSSVWGLNLERKRRINFTDDMTLKLVNTIKSIKDFNANQEFFSPNLESYIGIDSNKRKICIVENKHRNYDRELSENMSNFDYKHYIYSFDEII